MKKLLLSGLFSALSIFAVAQSDVSVTIDAPTAGANLAAGTAFTFDVTVTNNGTTAITAMDSIYVIPTVNGSAIGLSNGGILGWIYSQPVASNGGTATFSNSMNLTGGVTGPINMCGVLVMRGPNWTGVVESDTTNNVSCANVNWTNGTIGISEFAIATLTDDSYYSNGVYNVRLNAADAQSNMTFELISLTGKVVQTATFSTKGSQVSEDITLTAPSKGIYIARITSAGKPVSTRKVVVQ